MVRLAVVILLLLVLAACGNGGPQEWSRAYEGYLLHTDHTRFAVVLVRDGRTGRPIEGAAFRAHPEGELGPDGWAPRGAETKTDAFGLAHIPRRDGDGDYHWVVEAEGYAPTEEYGAWLSETVDLVPCEDRFGRILDVYGNAVPNVRVEYKVGCAHSPGLRRTITDKEGCFTLRRICGDGDVPLERGGIRAGYWPASGLSTKGEPVAEFHALPGHTVTGQILDAEGRPAAHARIHAHTTGRGPSTTAGPNGHFTLDGTEREPLVAVYHGEDGFEEFGLSDYRQDGPIVLRLDQKADEPETVHAEVKAPAGTRVHFIRETDGRRFSGRSVYTAAAVSLPPGPYLMRAGAPDERYVAEGRRVEVGPDNNLFTLSIEEQPTLQVVIEDLPESADSWLIFGGYCYAKDMHSEKAVYYLPPHTEATVVTEAWGRRKIFPVHAAAAGVRRVYLDWAGERPARIQFGTVPECVLGYRIPGEQVFVSDTRDKIETWATGRHTLRVLLESGDTHDIEVDLFPGGVLQFDEPNLPPAEPRREITVLLSDGSPAEVRSCWFDGRDDMTGLPGAHFRIRTSHPDDGFRATRYGRLEGAGPWTVRLGSAALRVTLTREDSDADRVLYVDGEVFQLESDPTAVVTGLRAGPHTLIVGAGGHVGRAMRVVLEEGETREIRVRLARR